jgi:hypothetical protein
VTLIQTAWGWERGERGGPSYLGKKRDRNMLANLLILLFFHKVNSNTYVLEKLLKKVWYKTEGWVNVYVD